MGADFKPTAEQQAIADAFAAELRASPATRRHLIINAGAGTGKTTTLRLMSEDQRDYQGLYIAFNKSVADAAAKVFGRNVECRTSHSLAYRHIANSEYAPLLQKTKTGPQRDDRQAITKDFNMNSRRIFVEERRKSGNPQRMIGGFQLVSLALGAIERFCQTAAREPSSAHVVAPRNFEPANFEAYREAVWAEIGTLVHSLWADLLDPNGKYMRFTHGTYLKLFALSAPVLNYDFILLDEAQDTAPVTEEIVTRQGSHALLVMVGDPSQAIYGFTGARDSMTRFEKSGVSFQSLTLSESWRFGPEIADAANALLEQTDREMRIIGRGRDGEVLHHLHESTQEIPTAYVCRSNFDVIEAALSAIARGVTVDTSSVDLSDIEAFLDGAQELKAGTRTQKGGLGAYARWAEFELDYEDGVPMTEGQRVGMMLLDKYATEAQSRAKIATIKAASASPREADVKVITIHKAKGGEWLDVSIRYESAFRKVRDKTNPDQKWWEVADPHLAYVAVTRAIHVLDPGHLWPLVEYGIVCDPGVLLARARGMCGSLSAGQRAKLEAARTPKARSDFADSLRGVLAETLINMGVREATSAVEGFVDLMHDVVVAVRKSEVTAGESAPPLSVDVAKVESLAGAAVPASVA